MKIRFYLLAAGIVAAALFLSVQIGGAAQNSEQTKNAGQITAEQNSENMNARVYPMTGLVIRVDYDADAVTVEDFNGNAWTFAGAEDWQPGDLAALLMDDNGTPIIYDDSIICARYDGWLDGWREN